MVGEVTQAPVMKKGRGRTTKEGGTDIDIIKKLEEARKAVRDDLLSAASKGKRDPFKGEFD